MEQNSGLLLVYHLMCPGWIKRTALPSSVYHTKTIDKRVLILHRENINPFKPCYECGVEERREQVQKVMDEGRGGAIQKVPSFSPVASFIKAEVHSNTKATTMRERVGKVYLSFLLTPGSAVFSVSEFKITSFLLLVFFLLCFNLVTKGAAMRVKG